MNHKFYGFFPFFSIVIVGIIYANCVSSAFSQGLGSSAPQIRLVIFCDGTLQPMEAQQWGRALNECGFQSVQIRSGDSSDVLDIQDSGGNLYQVSGMLGRDSRVWLPGNAVFTLGRVREMKSYLEEQIAVMQQQNIAAADAESNQLSNSVQEQLFADLSAPVGFSTIGMTRKKAIQKIAHDFTGFVRFPSSIRKAFDDEDFITEELETVSRGTALAYILRYIGYCIVPENHEEGSNYVLKIAASGNVVSENILPVGYMVENAAPDALYERFQASVDGVSAAKVLESLQKRLNIPFLYDYNSMAGQGIEPSEVFVSQKAGKFTYKQLLDAVLYQTKLMREVRTDEAGNVFFWITTSQKAQTGSN